MIGSVLIYSILLQSFFIATCIYCREIFQWYSSRHTKFRSKSHLYQKQNAALFSFFPMHWYSCLWKSRSAYSLGFDWTYHHRIALLWKSVIIKLSRYRIGKLEIDSSFCGRVYFKFIFIAKFNEQPPWLTGSWCEFNKIFIRWCICLLNVL